MKLGDSGYALNSDWIWRPTMILVGTPQTNIMEDKALSLWFGSSWLSFTPWYFHETGTHNVMMRGPGAVWSLDSALARRPLLVYAETLVHLVTVPAGCLGRTIFPYLAGRLVTQGTNLHVPRGCRLRMGGSISQWLLCIGRGCIGGKFRPQTLMWTQDSQTAVGLWIGFNPKTLGFLPEMYQEPPVRW